MQKHALPLLALGVALALTPDASADQVILDDLIVDGSICAGQDCVNGESFGFDTLRLKENNLRIKAQDTSSSASFPTNDWQITFNDSANGGANKFSIDDIDGGRTPFTIEAGAPSHSLYVEDGGRLGLGTNTPVTDIHVKTRDTPTLRLEQDGTGGFTPQTWDVAGNESNFFVRDATNGSTLPFRIYPGAPSSSLAITATGNVGIGLTNPSYELQVDGTGTVAAGTVLALNGTLKATGSTDGVTIEGLNISNTGGSYVTMENTFTNDTWYMTHQNADAGALIFASFVDGAGDGAEMTLDTAGNLTIAGALTTTGATCNAVPCDGTFQPDFEVPSIDDHAAYMWSNSFLKGVGSTKADQPFNVTRKTTGILHELEIAHIYIEQLSARLDALENK